MHKEKVMLKTSQKSEHRYQGSICVKYMGGSIKNVVKRGEVLSTPFPVIFVTIKNFLFQFSKILDDFSTSLLQYMFI